MSEEEQEFLLDDIFERTEVVDGALVDIKKKGLDEEIGNDADPVSSGGINPSLALEFAKKNPELAEMLGVEFSEGNPGDAAPDKPMSPPEEGEEEEKDLSPEPGKAIKKSPAYKLTWEEYQVAKPGEPLKKHLSLIERAIKQDKDVPARVLSQYANHALGGDFGEE